MKEIGVLLVDDHPDLARIAMRFLQRDRQVTVLRTTAAQNLVRMIEQMHPQVVLLDLDGSNHAGLDTIARLRARMPHLGIIALTLFDAVGYREASFAAGANDFVVKDALGTELLAAIHRVAENSSC